MIQRETIKLKEILLCNNYEDFIDNKYVFIECSTEYHDTEKGFVEKKVIIRRKSDEKFFKFSFNEWLHGENDILEKTAIEVFPKETKKIVYV